MQKHFLPLIIIALTFTSGIESVFSQTTTIRPVQTTQRSLKLLRSFEAQSAITAVDMSPDGKTLVIASKGDVQVWNLDTGNVQTHSLLDSQYANIQAIAISPDQQTFVTGSSGLDITTQSNSSGCTSSSGNGSFGWSCNLGSSSTQTIKSTGGGAIQVWERSTGKNLSTLESLGSSGFGFASFGSGFDFLRFSADGNMLITSQQIGSQCQTKFRDLKTGKVITQLNSRARLSLESGQSCKQILAINPRTSRQVIYASSLSIHNIGSNEKPSYLSVPAEGKDLAINQPFLSYLEALGGYAAFSADGNNVAISDGNSIFIWQPAVNQCPQYNFVDKRSLEERKGSPIVNTLSFSPDSQILVSGDMSGIIRLWDFKNSNQPSRTIAHVRQPIKFIGFRPDDNSLVSVGSDRTIKIWEIN
jgi:WD40 repeat protein